MVGAEAVGGRTVNQLSNLHAKFELGSSLTSLMQRASLFTDVGTTVSTKITTKDNRAIAEVYCITDNTFSEDSNHTKGDTDSTARRLDGAFSPNVINTTNVQKGYLTLSVTASEVDRVVLEREREEERVGGNRREAIRHA